MNMIDIVSFSAEPRNITLSNKQSIIKTYVGFGVYEIEFKPYSNTFM